MLRACVKNVFFMFNNSGIYCGLLFTESSQNNIKPQTAAKKTRFLHIFSELKTHTKSTTKKSFLELLDEAFTHNPHSLLLPLLMKFNER